MITATIDSFASEISQKGKNITENDVYSFDVSGFIEKATDYSGYSNLRTQAMIFDQKVVRLQEAIKYTDSLLEYAEKNLNGESRIAINETGKSLKRELENLMENSIYRCFYRDKN